MSEVLPWNGLTQEKARRVDKHGKHDFFWAVVDQEERKAMALLLPNDLEPILPLPRIRSLDLRYRSFGARDAFVVSLKDPEQTDLFLTLCRDLVGAGEVAETPLEALDRTIRRTLRWHHLLRGGASDRLSVEEQRGLIGELNFLSQLCESIGPAAAIEAWKGPEDAAKDFELHRLCVEVKARRGAARPQVQISSIDQLSDVEGAELVLLVADVDAAVRPEGQTLTDHVRVVNDIFTNASLSAYGRWESLLVAAGFDWEHDYSDRRWTVGKRRVFLVTDGFPRLPAPAPNGVLNIKYSIALDACSDFEIEGETFARMIEAPWNTISTET